MTRHIVGSYSYHHCIVKKGTFEMYGALYNERDIPSELRQYFEEVETSCGAPYRRMVDRPIHGKRNTTHGSNGQQTDREGASHDLYTLPTRTIGWQPTCKCPPHNAVPCVVLDPFSGAGTTGVVAIRHGRGYVGVELNPEYAEMSIERLQSTQPMLAGFVEEGTS